MSGLLADLYSAIDSQKRKLKGLLDDPVETIRQGLLNFRDDQNAALTNNGVAYQLPGYQSVLLPKAQIDAAKKKAADDAANMAFSATFIGPNAKTWDALSAKKAQEMAAQGVDPRRIWSETGNWKGPDGNWRQEIPDNQAMFNTSIQNSKKIQNDLPIGLAGIDVGPAVGGIVDHPELYKAYGSSLNSNTKIGNKNTMFGDGVQGSFDKGVLTLNAPAKAEDALSTSLHELQHAIQQREGWARGGSHEQMGLLRKNYIDEKNFLTNTDEYQTANKRMYELLNNPEKYNKEGLERGAYVKKVVDWFSSQPVVKRVEELTPIPADSTKAYRLLAGEAEARATQARIPLDAAQRRALFPEDSYDVPMNQLIIRGLLN